MTNTLTDPTTMSLSFPAKSEYLAFCRLLVSGLSRARELDEETVADLKLAVTEACSNSVRHAYEDGNGIGHLRVEVLDDRLVVEVEDAGRGFDDAAYGTQPTEPREANMGLSIIGALADEVLVTHGPDGRGSLIRFTKNL